MIVGDDREQFSAVPGAETGTLRPEQFGALRAHELTGHVLLPDLGRPPYYSAVPDDNRTVILPRVTKNIEGREYALAVKGVGARTPMYGPSPVDFVFQSDFASAAPDPGNPAATGLLSARVLTCEHWFGDAPWGAQGKANAEYAISYTDLATSGCNIHGFYFCPVIEAVEIPEPLLRDLGVPGRFWYQRYPGPFYQQHRFVPSNVRLYYQSEISLGKRAGGILDTFALEDPAEVDAFIDNYVASGVAALTLFSRTLRPCEWGVEGLDYDDVWLDKDALVAPDGTLHFADLEGLEWFTAGQDWTLAERVRKQFGRNFYEFMYGLDLLLRERATRRGTHPAFTTNPASQRVSGLPTGDTTGHPTRHAPGHANLPRVRQADLRETAANVMNVALARDPLVEQELTRTSLSIHVRSRVSGWDDVALRLIDLR